MEKIQDDIVPQKDEHEVMRKDVKTAAQSGDNDADRIVTVQDDKAKEETDKAYLQNKEE